MKKLFITLLILILLPVFAVGIFLLTFDLNRYRGLAETELSKSFNYPVQIGSMTAKPSFIPTIAIRDFKILTPKKDNTILNIPSMEATIELAPLIKKRVEIQKINIPTISIDSTYIEKEAPTSPLPEGKTLKTNAKKDLSHLLWIEDIQIGKLIFFFKNEEKKDTLTIENFNIKKLATFELNFNYLKDTFKINGNLGTLTEFLGPKNVLPIDLTITNKSNTITIKGQIGDLAQLSKIRLDLNAIFPDFSKFLKFFKLNELPFLEIDTSVKFSTEGDLNKMEIKKLEITGAKDTLKIQGEGTIEHIKKSPLLKLKLSTKLEDGELNKKLNLNPFELNNQVTFKDKIIEVKDIKYLANKTDLQGKIILDLNKTPMNVDMNLTSFYFSLKDILQQDNQNSSQHKADKGKTTQSIIPQITFPWEILTTFDLNGQIQIQNVNLSANIEEYASINIRPVLKEGIFTSPIQIRLLTGTVNNIIRLVQKDKTIQLKSEAKNLSLNKARYINKELKNAMANSDFSIQTTGSTTAELLKNSNGKIVVEIIGGKIINSWFNDLIESLDSSRTKTAFSTTQRETNLLCGAINLNLDKGILTSQDQIVLQTEPINLVLNGKINLNTETLEVSILPSRPNVSKTENALTNMIQIIKLSGPWNDIQVGLDSQELLSNLLDSGLNALSNQQKQSSTSLCEKALGHAITQPILKQKVEIKKIQVPEQTKHKTDLKEQLFQSLSQVLKKAQ